MDNKIIESSIQIKIASTLREPCGIPLATLIFLTWLPFCSSRNSLLPMERLAIPKYRHLYAWSFRRWFRIYFWDFLIWGSWSVRVHVIVSGIVRVEAEVANYHYESTPFGFMKMKGKSFKNSEMFYLHTQADYLDGM